MTERAKFDVDLAFGEARESAFYKAICRAHVEVKSDAKARETGNLAIEIRQGIEKKLSGISVTAAEYWAHEFADDAWLVVRTSKLKDFIKLYARDRSSRRICGDNLNECVLVPIRELMQHLMDDGVLPKDEAA